MAAVPCSFLAAGGVRAAVTAKSTWTRFGVSLLRARRGCCTPSQLLLLRAHPARHRQQRNFYLSAGLMSKVEEDAARGGAAEAAAKALTAAKFAQGLPDVKAVEDLSARVTRVLGLNPGPFTLTGTNTYLVGSGTHRILVDTGEGLTEYADALKAQLKRLGAQISTVLITHHHYDHTGGIQSVLEIAGDSAKVFKHLPGLEGATGSEDGMEYSNIRHDDKFSVTGATLRAVATPGHTQDHMSFVLEEEAAVFTGDCVLGCGTTSFDDLGVYLRSLEKLSTLKPRRLYPGHGPVVEDGLAKIQAYVQHRLQRERQVLATLALPANRLGVTAADIAAHMYKDEGIPDSLLLAAAKSVTMHCVKLAQEGKVEKLSRSGGEEGSDEPIWRAVGPASPL